MVRSEAGIHISRCFHGPKGLVRIGGSVGYAREDRFAGASYWANFVDTRCTFRVAGLNPDRNIFVPSIEIATLSPSGRWSSSLRYRAQIASRFWDNSLIFELALKM